MTTARERENRIVPQTSQGNNSAKCDGCPRCQDPNAGFCTKAQSGRVVRKVCHRQ